MLALVAGTLEHVPFLRNRDTLYDSRVAHVLGGEPVPTFAGTCARGDPEGSRTICNGPLCHLRIRADAANLRKAPRAPRRPRAGEGVDARAFRACGRGDGFRVRSVVHIARLSAARDRDCVLDRG